MTDHRQLDDLQHRIDGVVRTDEMSRRIYGVDASIYRIMPLAVVLPRTTDDVVATINWAREAGVPIVPRGAATGTTGGCLGPGIVIDCSRHLTRIKHLDPDARLAVCEPGVIQDQLNAAAAPHGLRFGPDTSTGNRATLGGMLGNNASGAHSMRYGKTVDNIASLELAMADGSLLRCGALDADAWRAACIAGGTEGVLYRTVDRLRTEHAAEIRARFPAIQRRVSGYNLDAFTGPAPWNLAQLICGSEGTLGICTEMTVTLSPSPAHVGLMVLQFGDLVEALRGTVFCLEHGPFSLEMIDDKVIDLGRANPAMRGRTDWLQGNPGGLLVAEFDADSSVELAGKLDRFEAAAAAARLGTHRLRITDPAGMAQVWALRKAGLGILMGRRTNDRAIAFLEDVAVPPARLAEFMAAFRELVRATGHEAGFYGHAGVGCIHVRPMLDLRQAAHADEMLSLMETVSDLVLQYGGALSGEHGDGLVRSWLNEKMFGPTIYGAFREIKRAFDPTGMMNPGKIVDAPGPLENLKVGPETRERRITTRLDFGPEGGFEFAVGMCNGNGQCRKPTGVMCPSYQASGDERYTTRARAQALQGIVLGDLPADAFTSRELYEVLDWCLQCKGCQRECPSGVDMAKMKSEFLFHYQEAHGYSLRSRMFGALDRSARLAALAPGLANVLLRSAPAKALLGRLGIDPRRALPRYARETFSAGYLRQPPAIPLRPRARVLIFVDTYTEHHEPAIGHDAVRVLQALGCQVRALPYRCCGRPLISKGLLRQARAKAQDLVHVLAPAARDGWRIVGLEPSCIGAMRDEYPALYPHEQTRLVQQACVSFAELVPELLAAGAPDPFAEQQASVWVQGHCHQTAAVGIEPSLAALRAVPGFDVHAFDAGCCGMAGTFGYESEHYDFSLAVGEGRLFPAIRALPAATILLADGISCRHQIHDGVDRRARHLSQILASALA